MIKPQLESDNEQEEGDIDTLFVKQIDYKKIRSSQLKQYIKKHKLNNDINITGLTKRQLIGIIENSF